MDSLKCNICFNTYNSSNQRPRVLSCGHTFCEKCLNITIKDATLVCFQCRKTYELNSVLELPINFLAEGILKSLKSVSNDVSEEAKPRDIEGDDVSQRAISLPIEGLVDEDNISTETNENLKCLLDPQQSRHFSQKELLKKSAGVCIEHPSEEYMFRCSLHKCWVCEMCVEDLGDHPKHKCKIISFKEEIDNRRQEHRNSLEDDGRSCNDAIFLMECQIAILKEERDEHLGLVNGLQDLVEIHKKQEETLQKEIISYQDIIKNGKLIKQNLVAVEETISSADTLDVSNAARDIVKNKKIETRSWLCISQNEVDEGKLKIEKSKNVAMVTKMALKNRESLARQYCDEDLIKTEHGETDSKNMAIDIESAQKDLSQEKPSKSIEDEEVMEEDDDSEIEYENFKKNLMDWGHKYTGEDVYNINSDNNSYSDTSSNSDSLCDSLSGFHSDSGESTPDRDISDSEKCISDNELMELLESSNDIRKCIESNAEEVQFILDNKENYKSLISETCLTGYEIKSILKHVKNMNSSDRSALLETLRKCRSLRIIKYRYEKAPTDSQKSDLQASKLVIPVSRSDLM